MLTRKKYWLSFFPFYEQKHFSIWTHIYWCWGSYTNHISFVTHLFYWFSQWLFSKYPWFFVMKTYTDMFRIFKVSPLQVEKIFNKKIKTFRLTVPKNFSLMNFNMNWRIMEFFIEFLVPQQNSRLLTKSLSFKTPYELLYKHHLNYHNLKVFGCLC